MRKIESIIVTALALILLVVPSLGMIVSRTDTTSENRILAKTPSVKKQDGSFNETYLQDWGTWFEDHFAFRNQLVGVDAIVQSEVFQVSNVDTVVKGTDGWLYYKSSVDDYLGRNTLSRRSCYGIAHNLELVQQKLQQDGIDFRFTIAPNKNSLYGDNMPYYYQERVSGIHNRTYVGPYLKALGVNYTDLFEAFEAQDQVLYLKTDSHWNQKGAVLAYNTLMDALGKEHEDYSEILSARSHCKEGDLAKALYPLNDELDYDYTYAYEDPYEFTNEATSWEDFTITTKSEGKAGNLLMFRDSFGNTLSPLMANEYGTGTFSKATVYPLDPYVEEYTPDTVVMEIVERNLNHLVIYDTERGSSGPPIMTGPVMDLSTKEVLEARTEFTLSMAPCISMPDYMAITGTLDPEALSMETNIILEVTQGSRTTAYGAYQIQMNDNENGFLLYLKQDDLSGEDLKIRVITENDGVYTVAAKTEIAYEKTE